MTHDDTNRERQGGPGIERTQGQGNPCDGNGLGQGSGKDGSGNDR